MSDFSDMADHYNLPADAVRHLMDALRRGHGRQAQFSHPALGGMGQWSVDGMLMIGEMSNHALKAKVAALCADLAPLAGKPEAQRAAPREDLQGDAWWPESLGQPACSGAQNGARYAVFPKARRLAVQSEGGVTLYNTGSYRISGISQQQGGGRAPSFVSQFGTVRLRDFTLIG